jgi:hypothetical protein
VQPRVKQTHKGVEKLGGGGEEGGRSHLLFLLLLLLLLLLFRQSSQSFLLSALPALFLLPFLLHDPIHDLQQTSSVRPLGKEGGEELREGFDALPPLLLCEPFPKSLDQHSSDDAGVVELKV